MIVRLKADEPRFKIKRDDVFEAERYWLDPMDKVTLLRRLSDDFNPFCNAYISDVEIIKLKAKYMGTIHQIRNDVLPAPFWIYQRKGFVECDPDDAYGCIEHTREGDKRYWLYDGFVHWREVTAVEYLEALK